MLFRASFGFHVAFDSVPGVELLHAQILYGLKARKPAFMKGNYRWGVWGIQGFYKASIKYIDLLYGSYNGDYPPENVLELRL